MKKNHRFLLNNFVSIYQPHVRPIPRGKTKTKQTYYQKMKARKEAAERNHIEGKFSQGKNGYNLNEIRARLKNTSESFFKLTLSANPN